MGMGTGIKMNRDPSRLSLARDRDSHVTEGPARKLSICDAGILVVTPDVII